MCLSLELDSHFAEIIRRLRRPVRAATLLRPIAAPRRHHPSSIPPRLFHHMPSEAVTTWSEQSAWIPAWVTTHLMEACLAVPRKIQQGADLDITKLSTAQNFLLGASAGTIEVRAALPAYSHAFILAECCLECLLIMRRWSYSSRCSIARTPRSRASRSP